MATQEQTFREEIRDRRILELLTEIRDLMRGHMRGDLKRMPLPSPPRSAQEPDKETR